MSLPSWRQLAHRGHSRFDCSGSWFFRSRSSTVSWRRSARQLWQFQLGWADGYSNRARAPCFSGCLKCRSELWDGMRLQLPQCPRRTCFPRQYDWESCRLPDGRYSSSLVRFRCPALRGPSWVEMDSMVAEVVSDSHSLQRGGSILTTTSDWWRCISHDYCLMYEGTDLRGAAGLKTNVRKLFVRIYNWQWDTKSKHDAIPSDRSPEFSGMVIYSLRTVDRIVEYDTVQYSVRMLYSWWNYW